MSATTPRSAEYGLPRRWHHAPDVAHAGRRSFGIIREQDGQRIFRKYFHRSRDGWNAYWTEKKAARLFRDSSWAMPWIRSGWTLTGHPWFDVAAYPGENRLDQVLARATEPERHRLASEALSIVLDLYVAGYAHRDFHARNLALVAGRLQLHDFEFLLPFPPKYRPRFPESYDITGQGLPSPARTNNMGFNADRGGRRNLPVIAHAAGISWDDARRGLADLLRAELLTVSKTFRSDKGGNRHVCKTERIYCSFAVPGLVVRGEEAQRNAARRFARYGMTKSDLAGKRILDLGCHTGGMLFAAQEFQPGQCRGVEYDLDKVRVARRIAAFADLPQVHFQQGDIDRTSPRTLGGGHDVVFCFAIERHLTRRRRLYRLLGRVTRELLLFETNSRTDPAQVERELRRNGFRHVAQLGMCDDDSCPENNVRHLLKAWK